MTHRIVGTTLVVAASLVAVGILVSGGAILPHILGPIVIATVGIGLLNHRRA